MAVVKATYPKSLRTMAVKVGIEPDKLIEMQRDQIRKMRQEKLAPVDTVGCAKLADPAVDEETQRFHTLIALMLSSQTKDEVTASAMTRLKAHGLTVQTINKIDQTELDKLLGNVGFHATKAGYIKRTAAILAEKYNGDIPPTFKEMIELPGVGPKMAHLLMHHAWGIVEGIAVDTHVHRISNRIGWVETKNPNETSAALCTLFVKDSWGEINELLVGFGQTICAPVRPKCEACTMNDICPSAFKYGGKRPVKPKARKVKNDDLQPVVKPVTEEIGEDAQGQVLVDDVVPDVEDAHAGAVVRRSTQTRVVLGANIIRQFGKKDVASTSKRKETAGISEKTVATKTRRMGKK